MHVFPFIWLLFNTDFGRIILGLFVAYIIIYIFGWWLIPVIAVVVAIIFLYDYYSQQKFLRDYADLSDEAKEECCEKNKSKFTFGIIFLVIAVLSALGILLYNYWDDHKYDNKPYNSTLTTEEVVNTVIAEPDTVMSVKTVTKDPIKPSTYRPSSSSRSYSSSYYSDDDIDDDNMRGFDPASEDDMEDNGMTRYMEVNDEEGWD